MCGICGFYSIREEKIEELIEMNSTMIHRGPNDHGEEIYSIRNGYSVGLAQRRLSIVDLSVRGHQPMHSSNGRVTVIYNGEIYNFQDLKEELQDYPFCSNCDTEIIIAAYLKWGVDCVKKFNGMFSIALLDREDDSLYLVRDRIGKKPLYYYKENDNIFFGSELKPIMKVNGFEKRINVDIIGNYLHHMCVPTPYSVFENVYKLNPGSILRFRYGEVKLWKYWDVADKHNELKNREIREFECVKEELKIKLKEAVKRRMIADVPIGAFLSGGYDSSLVCAIAQELSDKPIKTYCIGFEQKEINEAEYAKKVARYLQTDHTEMYISSNDMVNLIEDLPYYYDEPFADSSQIATMLVSKLARKDVTVVLSGDGGDEFFGGYNVYSKLQHAQRIDLLGAIIYYAKKIPWIKEFCDPNLTLIQRMVSDSRDKNIKTQIGVNTYIEVIHKILLHEGVSCYYPIETRYKEKKWDIRRMLLDMDTYLPNDILCKVDRASMKYSLECRCPLLDKEVMEYSYKIPQKMKVANGDQKKILKSIAYDYIPRKLLDRPKAGFCVPVNVWLRNQLKDKLEDYISSDFLIKQQIFNVRNTQKFILNYIKNGDQGKDSGANFSKLVWPYFVFQQWYEEYML